jgi:hypothetical protein
MQLKSNALPNLIWRLKPAIDPATRFFLVALFIVGFASTYFGDLRSKTHPVKAKTSETDAYVMLERLQMIVARKAAPRP